MHVNVGPNMCLYYMDLSTQYREVVCFYVASKRDLILINKRA